MLFKTAFLLFSSKGTVQYDSSSSIARRISWGLLRMAVRLLLVRLLCLKYKSVCVTRFQETLRDS